MLLKLVTGARHSIGGSSSSINKVNLLVKETNEPKQVVSSSKQTVARLTVEDKLVTSSIVHKNNDGKSGHSYTSDNLLDDHHSDQLIEYTTTTDTPRLSSVATTIPLSSVPGTTTTTTTATTEAPETTTVRMKVIARKQLLASLYDAASADELTRNSDSNPLSRGASRSMGSRRIPIKKLVASALREQEYLIRSTTTTTPAPVTTTTTTTTTSASDDKSSSSLSSLVNSSSPFVTQRPRASSLTAVSRAIDRIRPRKRIPSQPPVPPAPVRLIMTTSTTTATPTTAVRMRGSSKASVEGKEEENKSSREVNNSSRLTSQAVTDANERTFTSSSSLLSRGTTTTTAATTTTHSTRMSSVPPSDLFNSTTNGSASGHSSRIIHSQSDKNTRKNDLSLPSTLLSSEMRRKLTPVPRVSSVKISSSLHESTASYDPVSIFSSPVTTSMNKTTIINSTTTTGQSHSTPITTRNVVNKLLSSPIIQEVSLKPRVTSTNGRGQDVPSIRKNLVTVLTVTSDKFTGKYGSSDDEDEDEKEEEVEEEEESVEKVEPISDEHVSDEVHEDVNDELTSEREIEDETTRKEETSTFKYSTSDVPYTSEENSLRFSSTVTSTTPSTRVTSNSIDKLMHVDINASKKQVTSASAKSQRQLNVTASLSPVTIVASDVDDESNIDQENNDNIPSNVIGVAGIDYPIYSDIPRTDFDCRNTEYPGFYADQQTGCQVYHSCGSRGGRRHSFICPNGTIFSQEYLICDWWFNVRCSDSHNHFSLNKEAFSSPIKSSAVSSSTFSSSSTATTTTTAASITAAAAATAAASSSSTVSSTVTITPVANSTS